MSHVFYVSPVRFILLIGGEQSWTTSRRLGCSGWRLGDTGSQRRTTPAPTSPHSTRATWPSYKVSYGTVQCTPMQLCIHGTFQNTHDILQTFWGCSQGHFHSRRDLESSEHSVHHHKMQKIKSGTGSCGATTASKPCMGPSNHLNLWSFPDTPLFRTRTHTHTHTKDKSVQICPQIFPK